MARTVLVLTVALVACACGFHLRTWDVGESIESAYVSANARNPLEQPLRSALRQAGVTEAPSTGDATVVVELLNDRSERRSVSVSGQARAAEYEMLMGVQYRLTDGAGNELVPAQWLERERVFRIDRNNLVGSSEEQALIEREMRSDLVQQILRTVNTVAQNLTTPADAG